MALETEIPNYGLLQFVNSNFADLVAHYINMWQAYNQTLTAAAMNLCLYGGLAWVGVLTLKAPVDRLKTAASAFGIVMLVAMLLQPGTYKIGPSGGPVGLSAGAGWSLKLVGNVYQLMKSALDNVNNESAMELAFANAYHVTDESTMAKFNTSPAKQLYQDYISKCQAALTASAGSTPDTRMAGRYVGLFGSSGVNQVETIGLTQKSYDALKNKVASSSLKAQPIIFGDDNPNLGAIASESFVAEGVDKGRALLAAIPEDENLFSDQNSQGGYLMPSKEFYVRQINPKKATEGVHEFEKISDSKDNNLYLNPDYVEGSTIPEDRQARFYPKDCLQMYGLVTKAVANWTAAIKQVVPAGEQTAYMRDFQSAQAKLINDVNNRVEQEKTNKGTGIPINGSATFSTQKPNFGVENLTNEVMTAMQDLGMKFRQWMLKFKIPTMINGCAMLAGILVVLFPVICVFAVFFNPSMLISYMKLLAFAYMVPFINNLVLTMASTTLAMNGELMSGLQAGNFSENYPLLISAGSAQYVIFMALTAVEIIIAKMLIWDDVKGLSGFNPAGAATGMAATGAAVVGAGLKLGGAAMSLVGGPARMAGSLAKGAGGAAASAGRAVGGGGGGGSGGGYGPANMNVNLNIPKAQPASTAGAARNLAMPKSSTPSGGATPTNSSPTNPAQYGGPKGLNPKK